MSDKYETSSCEGGKCKHIRGIACDVKNCAYHEGECYCTADRIAVGPSHACSSTETVCVTFKPKAE